MATYRRDKDDRFRDWDDTHTWRRESEQPTPLLCRPSYSTGLPAVGFTLRVNTPSVRFTLPGHRRDSSVQRVFSRISRASRSPGHDFHTHTSLLCPPVMFEHAGQTLGSVMPEDASATKVLRTVADRIHARDPDDLAEFPTLRGWFSSLFADTAPGSTKSERLPTVFSATARMRYCSMEICTTTTCCAAHKGAGSRSIRKVS